MILHEKVNLTNNLLEFKKIVHQHIFNNIKAIYSKLNNIQPNFKINYHIITNPENSIFLKNEDISVRSSIMGITIMSPYNHFKIAFNVKLLTRILKYIIDNKISYLDDLENHINPYKPFNVIDNVFRHETRHAAQAYNIHKYIDSAVQAIKPARLPLFKALVISSVYQDSAEYYFNNYLLKNMPGVTTKNITPADMMKIPPNELAKIQRLGYFNCVLEQDARNYGKKFTVNSFNLRDLFDNTPGMERKYIDRTIKFYDDHMTLIALKKMIFDNKGFISLDKDDILDMKSSDFKVLHNSYQFNESEGIGTMSNRTLLNDYFGITKNNGFAFVDKIDLGHRISENYELKESNSNILNENSISYQAKVSYKDDMKVTEYYDNNGNLIETELSNE